MGRCKHEKNGIDAETFASYKRSTIKAAKDLGYRQEYIEELKAANSIGKLDCIMARARHEKFGD